MKPITEVNLTNVDLNLFHVLHTVLEEKSATAAAQRLNVTQSAVSNALARLRVLLDDPIVVRSARGLVPTPRALQLAPLVAAALTHLRAAVATEAKFDPATTTQCFTLACTDGESAALLPSLAELFARRMPNASMRLVTLEYMISTGGLANGEIDAVLGLANAVAPQCRALPLFTDDIVAVVRRGHPTITGDTLSLDQYFATPHVKLAMFGGRPSVVGNQIEKAFAKHKRPPPKIAVSVPQFNMVALATSRTDYIGGLPRRVAEVFSEFLPLRILESPVEMPKIEVALVWHERTTSDPGLTFFRQAVVDAVELWKPRAKKKAPVKKARPRVAQGRTRKAGPAGE